MKRSKREPLACSKEQGLQLRSLLARGGEWAGTPKGKRLRVIALSTLPHPVREIASAIGIKAQRVYQIQNAVVTRGMETEIAELETFASDFALKSAKVAAHAGRKGYESWEQYAGGEFFQGETYVELATLILAQGLQLAAFVVSRTTDIGAKRPRKPRDDVSRQISLPVPPAFREVRDILDESSSAELFLVPWTRVSTFDSICESLFRELTAKAEALEGLPADTRSWRETGIEKIRDLFPAVRHCIIFAAGESAIRGPLIDIVADGVEYKLILVDDEAEFVQRLEMAVYIMRNRVAGIGLLPSYWQLNDKISASADDEFDWQSDQFMVDRWMVRRLAVRDFFALKGALFEPGTSLLGMLPYTGHVKFKTLGLQPKIEILEHREAEQLLLLNVQPLPEIHYSVSVRCAGDPREFVQRLREVLRSSDGDGARRVFYSTDQEGGGQNSNASSTFEQILAQFRAGGSGGAGVVLIQRHFLCPESDLSPTWVAEQISSMADGAWVLEPEENQQGSRLLVVKIDHLSSVLRTAFEANRYGDAIAELGDWQGSLLNHSAIRPGQTRLQWLALCASMNAFADTTYYYFQKEAGAPAVQGVDYVRRIRYAHEQLCLRAQVTDSSSVALMEQFAEMQRTVKAALAGGDTKSAVNALAECQRTAMTEIYASGATTGINIFSIPYDPEDTFARLMLDLDADFLLRHLTAEDRARLEQAAEQWRDLSVQAIQFAFWPAGIFQAGRVLALCSEKVRRKLAGCDVELSCCEALTDFATGRMRVPRWVLETGQRMLLEGRQPVFFAVQSEEDLLRSWRSFLALRLRRVCDASETPKMESLDAMRAVRPLEVDDYSQYDAEPDGFNPLDDEGINSI